MVKLNEIADNSGARKDRIRVGRGIGCGKGKTCGRGVKGQKSRTGVAIKGFEGGQMPIFRRLPKRGFNNIHRLSCASVNLGELQRVIDAGLVDASQSINYETLVASGLVRTSEKRIKLLANGELTSKVNIKVDKASKQAISYIEKLGGSVELVQG